MMVQSILVGMDWGESTESLASIAPELAVALDASVQAVYVEDVALIRATRVPPVPLLPPIGAIPYDSSATRDLEDRFKREESRLGRLFLRLVADTRIKGSFLVERGEVTEILVRESRAHDLLLLGKYSGTTEHPERTIGAHVERILRRAYCPVVLVPPGAELGARFLVAYDGSAGAHRALAVTLRLAAAVDASVTVVTVATEEEASRLLSEAEAYTRTHKRPARVVARHGDPAEQVTRELRESDYSLLAMGAFGQSRLKEFFGANVTHDLLRRLDRATLVCGPMED